MTKRLTWVDFVHLNWSGRVSALWYPLRRLLIPDAPDSVRCWMGAPVGSHVHCPRSAGDDLWCRHHAPKETK